MRKNFILFFILWFAIGNALVAQPNWNLTRCISFAIQNNISLKKMDISERLSSEDLSQSKRNLLPSISASSSAGFSFGRSVNPTTNIITDTRFFNNNYSASASLTLFSGFNSLNQIEYQKFRKRASELNKLNATDDLAFSVMTSYFNVLYYEGMLNIATEQVETSKINLKKTEKQVELGLKSETDQLEMSANMEKEELNRIQMENSLKKTMLQLKQQMNLTDKTEIVLEKEQSATIALEKPDQESLFSAYTEWSPYYQSFVTQMHETKTLLAIYRSQLYPSLYANGSISTGYYKEDSAAVDFKTQFKNKLGEYVGVSLSIPIFNRWSNRSDIKIAKLNIENAQNTLEQEKQKLYFEMANNLNDLEALEKEYNQYIKQQAADKLVYEAAEKKLGQGLISIVDFYIAKNNLANTNSMVLQAELQWEIKKKTLDFYMGKRFWE